jgi:hypothetical protein
MKRMLVLAAILLAATPLLAETYSWTDDRGTINFTEDFSQVPKKFRSKVRIRSDGERSTPRNDTVEVAPKVPAVTKSVAVFDNTSAAKDLYAGKKAGQWQLEFRSSEAAYKNLEQKLDELTRLIKNPVGISRERFDGLPQEFRETQKEYLQALKQYNELNEAANQAGLPAEFRK